MDEVIHIYLARGLTIGEFSLDDDEFLECERIPLSKMIDMVCSDEILDAKTQIAVLRAWKMMSEGK